MREGVRRWEFTLTQSLMFPCMSSVDGLVLLPSLLGSGSGSGSGSGGGADGAHL